MMVMMMITVMVIEAVYEIISVTDPRHLASPEDGHDGDDDDDDNRDDDRGCICKNKCRGFVTLIVSRRWS